MPERTCPVWAGYLLASPIRKLYQNPATILEPYVREGMTVLEIGPGMGFFTLPMARMVGTTGRVIAVDVQEGMLDRLRKRAREAGVHTQIDLRLCTPNSLGVADLAKRIDFILLFAVVHEIGDRENLFAELAAAARPTCLTLFAEPRGHVSDEKFRGSLALAAENGFAVHAHPRIRGSIAAVLTR